MYIYHSESLIAEYGFIDTLYLKQTEIQAQIRNDISMCVSSASRTVSILSQGDDKTLFDEICVINGDTTYNGDIADPEIIGFSNYKSFYPDITFVDVICNRAYDAEHSAGASIADLVEISYESIKDYIDCGYQGPRNCQRVKMVSEITAQDMRMLFRFFPVLHLTKLPEGDGPFVLTVKMTTSDGVERSAKITIYNPQSVQILG